MSETTTNSYDDGIGNQPDPEYDDCNLQTHYFNNNALEVYCSYAYTTIRNPDTDQDEYVFLCSIIGNNPAYGNYEPINIIHSSVSGFETQLREFLGMKETPDDKIYITPVSLYS